MKKLSVEEKAIAYDKALDVCRKLYNKAKADGFISLSEAYEKIFPELAESEDEKIRKALLNEFIHLQSKGYKFAGLEGEDIIAWLEKQEIKEHDVCDTCDEKASCINPCPTKLIEEQKSADNIESSAFKDKLLELFQKFRYIKEGMPTNGDIIDYVDEHIQELIGIVQNKPWSEEDEEYIKSLLDIINGTPSLTPGEVECHKDWLKSIKDRVQPQPKQKWSEKDQKIWEEISDMLWEGYKKSCSKFSWDDIRNWLKPKIEFFECRVQPQPRHEWSEEDDELYNDLSDTYFYNDEDYPEETYKLMLKRVLDWMTKRAKSLKPQSQWKPTEEQMIAIDTAINVLGKGTLNGKQLIELQEQLKKLKE